MKGEGAPRSVRAALRRSRSGRHANDDRRRTVAVTEDAGLDDPLAALNALWADRNRSAESAQDLSRSRTHEHIPKTGSGDSEGNSTLEAGKRKRRLRALSETLSGIMGGKKVKANGKDRDDREGEDNVAQRDDGPS
jgi:hypothetical protein